MAWGRVPRPVLDGLGLCADLRPRTRRGPVRGGSSVVRDALADVVLGLAAAAEARPEIVSADLNPLIVVDGRPVAVDALVEVTDL